MSQTRAQIRAHPAQQLDLPALSRILSGVQLEEAKLEELRRWGQALRDAGREESVAAGRAILMLIEELERFSLKLRLAGEQLEQVHPVPNSEVDVGAGDRSTRRFTGVFSRCSTGIPINLLRPNPSRLKRQA